MDKTILTIMKKWIIENGVEALWIFIGYSLAWYFGWQLSVNFETIADITSWFLPAGIRVTSLLLINKKYWGVIALAEFTGIYAVNITDNPFTSNIGEAIDTFLPILIYMPAVINAPSPVQKNKLITCFKESNLI